MMGCDLALEDPLKDRCNGLGANGRKLIALRGSSESTQESLGALGIATGPLVVGDLDYGIDEHREQAAIEEWLECRAVRGVEHRLVHLEAIVPQDGPNGGRHVGKEVDHFGQGARHESRSFDGFSAGKEDKGLVPTFVELLLARSFELGKPPDGMHGNELVACIPSEESLEGVDDERFGAVDADIEALAPNGKDMFNLTGQALANKLLEKCGRHGVHLLPPIESVPAIQNGTTPRQGLLKARPDIPSDDQNLATLKTPGLEVPHDLAFHVEHHRSSACMRTSRIRK
jgi:hypothetical protein